MDQDEEEEDFAEEEEEEEEEEEDIYNKDKKKIFGDTNHYCPVMLKEKFVLWPGVAECAAKYRERTYFFSSTEARGTFLEDPESFLPSSKPLEVRNCQHIQTPVDFENSSVKQCTLAFCDHFSFYLGLQPPPIRLLIVGPKGAGKTLHGRCLAKQMGVFHISFKDRLQELIIAKTKKRIGPEYEDDEEESGEQAVTAPDGLEETGS